MTFIATPILLAFHAKHLLAVEQEVKVTPWALVYAQAYHKPVSKLFLRVVNRLVERKLISISQPVDLDPESQVDIQGVLTKIRAVMDGQRIRIQRLPESASRRLSRMTDLDNLWKDMERSVPHLLAALHHFGPTSVLLCAPGEAPLLAAAGLPYVVAKESVKIDPRLRPLVQSIRWLSVARTLSILVIVLLPLLIGAAAIALRPIWTRVLSFLLETFPAWGLALLVGIAGIALYQFRCRARLYYGIVECSIGIWVGYESVPKGVASDYFRNLLPFVVALYIIVRGLDNIGKAAEGNPSLHQYWRKWFGPNY